ncbi:MAG: hypothetical protein ACK55Z_19970, partial [bacterium]
DYTLVELLILRIGHVVIYILITVLIPLIVQLRLTSALTNWILNILIQLKRVLFSTFLFILQNSEICTVFSLGLDLG